MNAKLKTLANKIMLSALYSLIYLAAGYIIAVIVSHVADITIPDVSTYEGLMLLVVGIIKYMVTNPISNHFFRLSTKHEEDLYQPSEDVKPKKKTDNTKNNVTKYLFGNMTIIFAAFLITIFGNYILP